jgi:hypothetical protein
MLRWCEFEVEAPELSRCGREMLFKFGPGLAYLATVRADGGPRLHPFCPVIAEGGLYGLIGPSPKQADLLRDRRYALHSFPQADRDDEFYLTGRADRLEDPERAAGVRRAYLATGATSSDDELIFEFRLEHALLSRYKPHGEPDNWPPKRDHWHASRTKSPV